MSTINPNYDLALWKRFKEEILTCNETTLDSQGTFRSFPSGIGDTYKAYKNTIVTLPPTPSTTSNYILLLTFTSNALALNFENQINIAAASGIGYLKFIGQFVGSPGSPFVRQIKLSTNLISTSVSGGKLTITLQNYITENFSCSEIDPTLILNYSERIDDGIELTSEVSIGADIMFDLVEVGTKAIVNTGNYIKDIYAVTHIDSQVGTLQYDLGTGTATDGNILLYKFNNTNNKYEPYTPTGTLIPDDINIGLDTVIGLLNTMIGVNGYEIEYTSPTKLNNETDNFYSRQVIVLNTETNTIISTVVEYSTDGHTWSNTVPSGTLTIGWVDKPLANKIIELVGVGTAVTTVIPATAKSISIRRKSGNPVVSDGINPPYTLSQANETVSWSNSNMSNTITVTVTSIIDKVVIVTTE